MRPKPLAAVVGGLVMHAPLAVREIAAPFHRRVPIALLGFGLVATIVWNAGLAYMAIALVRRFM
jgi:hypothetical protein